MTEVETLITADFPAVLPTKHSIELPRAPYISKNFVAYIEALVCAAPYFKTTDARNRLDARFNKAFKELDKQEDMRFDQYVARKLRTWFTRVPPTARVAAAADDDNTEGAGRPGGGWGGG